MSSPPLLQMRGIRKAFAGTLALSDATLTIGHSEIHALLGENGAGKSTLLSILSGALARDAGDVEWEGQSARFPSPQAAQKAGIAFLAQELMLVPQRSVAENVFLGREPCRFGWIDWRKIHTDAAALLARLGVTVDVRRPLSETGTAVQQMTAVARALSQNARLLVMDEPTSSLDASEIATLFDVLRGLKQEGVSVVFVSHKLDELYALCDRITILRDGHTVLDAQPLADLGRLELVAAMLGKDPAAVERAGQTGFSGQAHTPEGESILQAEHLRVGTALHDVSVDVRAGEMVGLAGLLGSGRTETVRAIYGADALAGGEVTLGDRSVRFSSPADAIRAGIGFCSEDRRAEGIVPHLSVRENLTLAALPVLARFGVVSRARQTKIVDEFAARLGIKMSGPEQPVRELSGGNQQKVLLARALCLQPKLLLLDEPTRGVDVGAKAEIQTLIEELVRGGMAVLMVSSEAEELAEGCDRIVVLRDGRTAAVLPHAEATSSALLSAMAGGTVHGD